MIYVLEAHPLVDAHKLPAEGGDLTYLFKQGERRTSLLDDRLNDVILERLRDNQFDASRDYVLLVGAVPGILRLGILIGTEYPTRDIRFLVHDAPTQRYREIRIY